MSQPRIQHPIVLVHGLFGFDRLQVGPLTVANYFPGVVPFLEKTGQRVLLPALSPTASVIERAAQLKAFIQKNARNEPVHIIAHSMGGLDARTMISQLGMAEQVLSLTTLGTPHKGTVFADWGIGSLAWMLRPVFELLAMPTQGFYDLTTSACKDFSDRNPDQPQVKYFSVAARHDGSFFTPEWLLPYHIVLQAEGPNDGVVSLASAEHGDFDVWDGDHFSLVNWAHPFGKNRGLWPDPAPRWGKILKKLHDAGF